MIDEPLKNESSGGVVEYSTPLNFAYYSPTPGKITLYAATANLMGSLPDEDDFTGLKECGFNTAGIVLSEITPDGVVSYAKVKTVIKKCHDAGILPFLSTPTLMGNGRKALVEYFANDSNLGGWSLPTADYDSLVPYGSSALAYSDIWKYDKLKNPQSRHVILMSARAGEVDSGVNYRDYLLRFQNNVQPSLWRTTVYPIVYGSSGNLIDARGMFYEDLEIFSLLSRYCERPFWYSVVCMSYHQNTGIHTPVPTISEMRFCAFSALAYGAQGLNYWCYRQREDEIVNGEVRVRFTNAPVNLDGSRNNQIWNSVKMINREVSALNEIFYGSYLVDVRHTKPHFTATKLLTGSFGPLKSLTVVKGGVMVSHLNTSGQNYLVIVSHCFREGIDPASQQLTLDFAEGLEITQIKLVNYVLTQFSIHSGVHQITLPLAGYLIYKWN